MHVNPTDAAAMQSLALHKFKDLPVLCNLSFGEGLEESQNLDAISQRTACQLADDKRVRQYFPLFEEDREPSAAGAKVLDPHGRIDKDHATRVDRRLRIG